MLEFFFTKNNSLIRFRAVERNFFCVTLLKSKKTRNFTAAEKVKRMLPTDNRICTTENDSVDNQFAEKLPRLNSITDKYNRFKVFFVFVVLNYLNFLF